MKTELPLWCPSFIHNPPHQSRINVPDVIFLACFITFNMTLSNSCYNSYTRILLWPPPETYAHMCTNKPGRNSGIHIVTRSTYKLVYALCWYKPVIYQNVNEMHCDDLFFVFWVWPIAVIFSSIIWILNRLLIVFGITRVYTHSHLSWKFWIIVTFRFHSLPGFQ